MRGIRAVVEKEWRCFRGSDRGLFIFYGVLVVSWSLFLAFRENPAMTSGPWWLVFFSVVVTANFSNTVFISERVNGALEILITAGFSRKAILAGKMLFILLMSVFMGFICLLLGMIIRNSIQGASDFLLAEDFLIFTGAAFLNTSGAAFLSVRMSNPRLLHIGNMFILLLIVILYSVLSFATVVSPLILVIMLFTVSLLFTWLAAIEFESERILRPVNL
jgi:ABC-type transport system involved in multi-copper enzyme maturation permease subunit